MTIARPTRRLGPFVLGPKIGSGGMAAVFAAQHQSSSGATRLVALKVMSTSLGSESEFRDLFMREARVASRIEHANVVRVYDSGEVDGELFLAMELIEGASLARLQRQNAPVMPIDIALRILSDLLRGLHFAHEQCDADGTPLGLVHQDVSPHNVLVGYDGVAKLLDFGVARLAIRERSRTDNVRGKPGYLAPEQIQLGRLDRRVDVFAAGVIAHELLTGARLFTADTIAAMHARILGEAIPRVDAVRDDVPRAIADVIERALRRDPGERWSTADELRRALRECATAIADDETVAAYVRQHAPPTWSRTQIERSLSEQVDVADLPTLVPRKSTPDDATANIGTTMPNRTPTERRTPLRAAIIIAVLLPVTWFAARSFDGKRDQSVAAPASTTPTAASASALAPEPAPTSTNPPALPPVASASASASAPPSPAPLPRATIVHAAPAPSPSPSAKPPEAPSPPPPPEDPFGHQ